jgi:hypothetical protein
MLEGTQTVDLVEALKDQSGPEIFFTNNARRSHPDIPIRFCQGACAKIHAQPADKKNADRKSTGIFKQALHAH